MSEKLNVNILSQPDYTTCGPTSLHAVYSYYKDTITLDQTIAEINQHDEGGGTIAVVLGKHALTRGYKVTIISYNVSIFDPSWFDKTESYVMNCLQETVKKKNTDQKHLYALDQCIEFLDMGGELRFDDLSSNLLHEILDKKIPILTGLSSTWLYREQRENSITNEFDAICGDPAGHFVVIDGYEDKDEFLICDPYHKNPISSTNHYYIDGTRLINSILLGISTYDGNLLLIEKKK